MSTVALLSELLQQPHAKNLTDNLSWLHEAKTHAKQQLAESHNYRGEAYRYSKILRLLDMPWLYEEKPCLPEMTLTAVHEAHYRIVFVDGVFTAQASLLPPSHQVTIQHLDSDVPYPDWLKQRFMTLPTHWSEQVNLLLAQSGVMIDVAAGVLVDKPMDIVHYYQNSTASTTHTRHAVHIQAHAHATINEYHIGTNTAAHFATTAMFFELDNHAALDYHRIRHGNNLFHHLHYLAAYLGKASQLRHFHADCQAQLLRADMHIELLGDKANAQTKALFIARAQTQIEHQWFIKHAAPETTSYSLIKGIADEQGQGICRARIDVLPSAPKTNAKFYNPNLLLSPSAQIDSLPELSILQDDVVCAHGATVGQLDANALFYLQSRGIALVEARQLLTSAFIQSDLHELPADINSYLTEHFSFLPNDATLIKRV